LNGIVFNSSENSTVDIPFAFIGRFVFTPSGIFSKTVSVFELSPLEKNSSLSAIVFTMEATTYSDISKQEILSSALFANLYLSSKYRCVEG
jgi:hypothetical protein